MHKPEPSPGCGEQPLPGPGLFSSVHCHLPCTGNTHWLPGTFTEMKSHLLKQTNPLSQSQSGTLTHRCPGPTVASTLTLGPAGRPGSPAPRLPPSPGHGRPGQAVGRTERWAARCGGGQADGGWMVGVARLGIRGVLSAWSSSFLSPWGTLCAAHGAGVVTPSTSGAEAGPGHSGQSQVPPHHRDPACHPPATTLRPPHLLRNTEASRVFSSFLVIIFNRLFSEQF